MQVMHRRLKSFHKGPFINSSNRMLDILAQVMRVSIKDKARDKTPSHLAAMVLDDVRVRVLGECL